MATNKIAYGVLAYPSLTNYDYNLIQEFRKENDELYYSIAEPHIVKLHDRLYSGIFFNYLRLDIDFIPHIGIANSKNRFEVKKWADVWNQNEFSIVGIIKKLTIIEYTNNIVTDISEILLK